MYFLAERGERRPDGRQALLAYAVGCNPDTDPFDDWWHLAGRELGGDRNEKRRIIEGNIGLRADW